MSKALCVHHIQSKRVMAGEKWSPMVTVTAFFPMVQKMQHVFGWYNHTFVLVSIYGRDEYPDASQFDGQMGYIWWTVSSIYAWWVKNMPKPFIDQSEFHYQLSPPIYMPKQIMKITIKKRDPKCIGVSNTPDIALKRFFWKRAPYKRLVLSILYLWFCDHTSD